MIVVLGGSGYVGQEICAAIARGGHAFESLSRKDVNYASADSLREWLLLHRPEYLINAAGYTGKPNVDACELHKADCLDGNGVLPGVIRSVCEELEIPWGHVSSGCIFTGTREDGQGFREEDAPNFSFRQDNCSFYSGCKALGEEVLQGAERCYIWRLRIPFDHRDSGRNYISKVMRYQRLLNAANSLSHLGEFAQACVDSFELGIPFGTYNVTNPGHVTTRDVTELLQSTGLCDREFSFFESEEEFMQLAAATPRSNCILDSSKAVNAGLQLRPVREALEEAMQSWVPEVQGVAGR